MSAAVSDFPAGTHHPVLGNDAPGVQNPETLSNIHNVSKSERGMKGRKIRKPSPKSSVHFLVRAAPCRSREGEACSSWALRFAHQPSGTLTSGIPGRGWETGSCVWETPRLGNKTGGGSSRKGALSDRSPQIRARHPGQIRWPQGPPLIRSSRLEARVL